MLDMSPYLATGYSADQRLANAILLSQVILAYIAVSLVAISNFTYHVFGQFGIRVILPPGDAIRMEACSAYPPTFGYTVAHILRLTPRKQVYGPEAGWVIAVMAY